jgi:glycosyltransferase involved in cell wall biosynthesis
MSGILKRAWVVIPAYQEAKVLRLVVEGVRRLAPRAVVVDDASTDDTAHEALAAGATVLRHVVNLGQGAALQTGIDYALAQGAEFVFTFDADGQHLAESLAVMADVQEKTGADVVLGSRTLGKVEGIPSARRLLLKAALTFTWMHARLRVTDTHNGLRLFTREAAKRIRISQPRMAHASEILSQIRQLGLRFEEAPVTVHYTEYSLAKGQKMRDAFRILTDILYASWARHG